MNLDTAAISVLLKTHKDPTLLITKALGTRIEAVTPILINCNQTGFYQG